MYEKLKGLLADTVPDFELRLKAEIAAEINRVKVEKNAVILGATTWSRRYFTPFPTSQAIPRSERRAAGLMNIIVFCGVRFMAETAKF